MSQSPILHRIQSMVHNENFLIDVIKKQPRNKKDIFQNHEEQISEEAILNLAGFLVDEKGYDQENAVLMAAKILKRAKRKPWN